MIKDIVVVIRGKTQVLKGYCFDLYDEQEPEFLDAMNSALSALLPDHDFSVRLAPEGTTDSGDPLAFPKLIFGEAGDWSVGILRVEDEFSLFDSGIERLPEDRKKEIVEKFREAFSCLCECSIFGYYEKENDPRITSGQKQNR